MGPVHMNEVQCSGFEKSITECHFNKEALGCSHEEDAAVRCNVPAMGFQESVRVTRHKFRVEVVKAVQTVDKKPNVWSECFPQLL